MESLHIPQTVSSPSIAFDPASGLLEIGGESYPENSFTFYAPVKEWVREFLSQSVPLVRFRVTLTYLNTSSTKCMIDILDDLESAFCHGADISVEWYYDPANERARDSIEELKEDFTMPFRIMPMEQYQ